MTYQPNPGYQQQGPHGFPPPSVGGPGQVPHPAGPQWPAPSPPSPPGRRRPALLIGIVAAILVAAGVLTVVLTAGGGSTSRLAAAPGNSPAAPPIAGSGAPDPSASAPGTSRPLPPPTPTGRPYENDDPQVGDCADLTRRPTGIIIYQADCADPAATLILDSVHPENEKCPGKGFFGLKSLSKQLMCFTYNFKVGDCVDMQIPRRAACADPTAPTGGKPVVTVADIRLGQQDGTGCANPALFLQVGKANERGIACLVDESTNTTSKPSR